MRFLLARMRNRWLRTRRNAESLSPPARVNLAALEGLDLSGDPVSYRYVALDLETTGLDLKRDRVVSIGAFRIVDGRISLGEIFYELVNPGRSIQPSSIKVHGIVPDMVAEARSIGDVLEDFLSFLHADILVAHHARFDLNFLNKAMRERYGFPLQNLVLDTVALCGSILFPRHPYPYGLNLENTSYSLSNIADHFGIDIYDRHNALEDALAAGMIFQRILARLKNMDRNSLGYLVKTGAVF